MESGRVATWAHQGIHSIRPARVLAVFQDTPVQTSHHLDSNEPGSCCINSCGRPCRLGHGAFHHRAGFCRAQCATCLLQFLTRWFERRETCKRAYPSLLVPHIAASCVLTSLGSAGNESYRQRFRGWIASLVFS